MIPKDFAVAQYVRFNNVGAFEDRFQLEFGGTIIEDLTREDLSYIQKAIDTALIYGAVVVDKKDVPSLINVECESDNRSSEDEQSADVNKED